MKFEEILEVIKALSKSQGYYGRLLRNIENMNKHELETIKKELERKNFKDSLDLILYLENWE